MNIPRDLVDCIDIDTTEGEALAALVDAVEGVCDAETQAKIDICFWEILDANN